MESRSKTRGFSINVCASDAASEKDFVNVGYVLAKLFWTGDLIGKSIIGFSSAIMVVITVNPIVALGVKLDVGADDYSGVVEVLSLDCVN